MNNLPWELYKKVQMTQMRSYIPGEDLSGMSISDEDEPKLGDMIARNASNHNDRWLVAKEYFEEHYESAEPKEGENYESMKLSDKIQTLENILAYRENSIPAHREEEVPGWIYEKQIKEHLYDLNEVSRLERIKETAEEWARLSITGPPIVSMTAAADLRDALKAEEE